MIPLATHSHFSRLAGTVSVDRLCHAARQRGYSQLALTDTDTIAALADFLAACRREELTPIIGAAISQDDNTPFPTTFCLVENATGYRSLCRLLTLRHREPNFSLQRALPRHHTGLIILTADPDLLQLWRQQEINVTAALCHRPSQHNSKLRTLARGLGIPAVALPDAYFCDPGDYAVHCLLRAIANRTTRCRLTAMDTTSQDAWLAPPAHYHARFAIWPETITATHAIAERCSFQRPEFGIVMPPWQGPDRQTAAAALREQAVAGARRRYGVPLPAAVRQRLEEELTVITTMGFASYFLVVRQIVPDSARTCGRGSGAASLVAYCLGLTNVCPIRHNLFFGRFLNPGRQDPPDLDIDFAWDERDAVLNNVLDRYRDRAAMVASHVVLQPRMAIRETARIYGLTESAISRVTRRLPWHLRWDQHRRDDSVTAIGNLPSLRDIDWPEPWPTVLRQAARIIGSPRHLSIHPGGVIITPDPVAHYVPVTTTAKGVPVIQWDKDAAEEMGLVKIDLLGNRSLAVIRDAINNLRRNNGTLAEQKWRPEEDPATRATVAAGATMGCFYIESPAMRLLQQKAATGSFDHLVIHSSIIRPAANEYIREYLRRLHGGDWEPLHPLLEEVLADSFGIMVYQEDVSRVACALAGFSTADADGLRKVLAKKHRTHRLRDYQAQFHAGCAARGVSPPTTEKIWRMMASFDGYSFCKPHSASYAGVSFQAAWLKTHFPAEFMAAVLSNGGGYYSTFAYVSEARRLGVRILPPDVTASDIHWRALPGNRIRVGLLAVNGLSHRLTQRIIRQRRQRPFAGLRDFLRRTRPAMNEARSLLHCGALDQFLPTPDSDRVTLLWKLLQHLRDRHETPHLSLLRRHATPVPPQLPPTPAITRLRREYKILGFLVDHHPMVLFNQHPLLRGTIKATAIRHHVGRHICFAGWLLTGKTVATRHGEAMEFLTFEDETGLVETIFFPPVYNASCHLLRRHHPFLLHGKVEQEFGATTLTVTRCQRLRPIAASPSPEAVTARCRFAR